VTTLSGIAGFDLTNRLPQSKRLAVNSTAWTMELGGMVHFLNTKITIHIRDCPDTYPLG
jgi:hypothetical protein